MKRFEGKVAIVTGGASGIGLATAKQLAMEGAHVVIAGRTRTKVQKALQDLQEGGAAKGLAVECDVADEGQVEACVQETLECFSHLDIVVNNAGVMIFKPIAEHTLEDWRKVLAVDLLGAFFFIRQAFKHMSRGGSVVNVSSIHARETTPLVAAYAAAKAAGISLTRSAALEGNDLGIRVNAVLPGAVDTPMLWENPNVKSGVEHLDKKLIGKPQDIAATIAFLASDEARFVQGAALVVDGGQLQKL